MKTIKIRRFYQANPSKTIRINLDNIGMLRQYINESNEPITNAMILFWLTGEKKYIDEHYEEKETKGSDMCQPCYFADWTDEEINNL